MVRTNGEISRFADGYMSGFAGRTYYVSNYKLDAICGSDLHLYQGNIPYADDYVIGHEPMGIVEEVGSDFDFTQYEDMGEHVKEIRKVAQMSSSIAWVWTARNLL